LLLARRKSKHLVSKEEGENETLSHFSPVSGKGLLLFIPQFMHHGHTLQSRNQTTACKFKPKVARSTLKINLGTFQNKSTETPTSGPKDE